MITNRTMKLLDGTLEVAEAAVEEYTRRLRSHENYNGFVDEIALLVETEGEVRELRQCLWMAGWLQFNTARDDVRTGPIRSRYEVEYNFFSHPDKIWRFEVMRITKGYSPLHGAIRKPVGGELCVPVHASFKTYDEENYVYAREHLDGMGLFEAQRCDSTYGRFSYWTTVDQQDAVPYLKPRVNLRDNGEAPLDTRPGF